MSRFVAIGSVSESLKALLEGEMQSGAAITVLAPDETSSESRRVNIYLFKIKENSALRNANWELKPGTTDQLLPPPLPLNLHYMVTPYVAGEESFRQITAQKILGDAMRVLFENSIVPEKYLDDELKDARERVQIIHHAPDMEELSRLWGTFSRPFRLSAIYEISVVQLDPLPARTYPMPPRVRQVGIPEVRAPYRPPVLTTMEPIASMPGESIRFRGANLAGWKVYAQIDDKNILDGFEIQNDSFEARLPDDIDPGFHEVRVDISHLFRRTFFVEILNAQPEGQAASDPGGME